MKKYLIFLTIFLSSLFFIGNIKADAKVLVDSADLDSNFSGTLTTEDLQEIYNNNSDYDFENVYKYYAIFVKHWERNVYGKKYNSNYLKIIFYNKIPTRKPYNDNFRFEYSDIKYLSLEYGCLNGTCTIDFDNIDLTKSVTYDTAKNGSITYMTTFGNSNTLFLAYDNMEPSLYDKEPTYTYEILEKENGLELKFTFENFDSEGYFYHLYDVNNINTAYNINPPMKTYSLNVYYDIYFKIILYDKDGEIISTEDIDVKGAYLKLKNNYSVFIRHNSVGNIGYRFSFPNGYKDETCFFGEQTGNNRIYTEVSCSTGWHDAKITKSNNILIFEIRKSDKTTVLFRRQENVISDLSLPIINFKTEKMNDYIKLNINVDNYDDTTMKIKYYYDNLSEVQINNNTTLNFYVNTTVYVNVYNANDEVISSKYITVIVDYSQLSNTYIDDINSVMEYFKNISQVNMNLMDKFNNFWISLKNSALFVPIIISFIGTILLLIISIIKR